MLADTGARGGGPVPALDRMTWLLDQWRPAGDGRCTFLECYSVMTGSMRASLDDGGFADPAWVDELLERFAVAYFEAVDAWDSVGSAPSPWAVAFDAAQEPDRPVLQHLLLGINAHINYDLVMVLADLLGPSWHRVGERERRRRQADYEQVNRVIARTVDRVQVDVVEQRSPGLGIADVLLGPVDEWMAARLLSRWRGRVWDDAVAMMEAEGDDERADVITTVEQRATRRAHRLLLRGS